MERSEVEEILSDILYPGYQLVVLELDGRLFLQGRYVETDIKTGKHEQQNTALWPLSRKMTKSEVTKAVWKMVTQSEEHRRRENFMVRHNGKWRRPFGPHISIDALCELSAKSSNLDYGLYVEDELTRAQVVAISGDQIVVDTYDEAGLEAGRDEILAQARLLLKDLPVEDRLELMGMKVRDAKPPDPRAEERSTGMNTLSSVMRGRR